MESSQERTNTKLGCFNLRAIYGYRYYDHGISRELGIYSMLELRVVLPRR